MSIETLKCPLNDKPVRRGAWDSGGFTSTGGQFLTEDPNHTHGSYNLTQEEIRLFEKLAPLPQPKKENKPTSQ